VGFEEERLGVGVVRHLQQHLCSSINSLSPCRGSTDVLGSPRRTNARVRHHNFLQRNSQPELETCSDRSCGHSCEGEPDGRFLLHARDVVTSVARLQARRIRGMRHSGDSLRPRPETQRQTARGLPLSRPIRTLQVGRAPARPLSRRVASFEGRERRFRTPGQRSRPSCALQPAGTHKLGDQRDLRSDPGARA
jgi:hypothetical protein